MAMLFILFCLLPFSLEGNVSMINFRLKYMAWIFLCKVINGLCAFLPPFMVHCKLPRVSRNCPYRFERTSSMTLLLNYLAPCKTTPMWRHDACSSFWGTREKLPVWSESALPVNKKEGKGEGKRSIGPWTKYRQANLIPFCPYNIHTHKLSALYKRLYPPICSTMPTTSLQARGCRPRDCNKG